MKLMGAMSPSVMALLTLRAKEAVRVSSAPLFTVPTFSDMSVSVIWLEVEYSSNSSIKKQFLHIDNFIPLSTKQHIYNSLISSLCVGEYKKV